MVHVAFMCVVSEPVGVVMCVSNEILECGGWVWGEIKYVSGPNYNVKLNM